MKNHRLALLFCLLLSTFAAFASSGERIERTPAFPGAEGWGRYTTGGRGGKVIHVTNLNDAGRGSLREAVEQSGARIIVFDVSGTIHLRSDLDIKNPNITIAGQTAPGDGICIADFPVSIATQNVIIRYMRFRPGNKKSTNLDGLDALTGVDSRYIIIDHCSLSWSTDECCTIYGNRFSTVQWCVIAQSLRWGGHSKKTHGYGGMMGGEGATYHHNLLAHHDSRCPRLGERPATGPRDTTDFRCNVMYNWSGQGCYGGENMNMNIVNNYYKPGPATAVRNVGIQKRICGIGVNENESDPMYLHWATVYVDGNVNPKYADVTADNWKYGIYDQLDVKYRNNPKWGFNEAKMHLSEPVKHYYVTDHSAEMAYERVLAYAGASLRRDALDELFVSDTREGAATYTGDGDGNAPGIIDSPDDNRPADAPDNWSPWPTLESAEAPLDTDGDGMPDVWEAANGLDPNDPADALLTDDEGYTMIECYINSLVADITEAQNAGGTPTGEVEYRDEILDTYEISTDTRETGTWNFGYGITLKGEGSLSTSGRLIGMQANRQFTISLPAYAYIYAVKFEGRGRYTTDKYSDASLIELAGNSYAEGTYTLPKGAAEGSFFITLPEAVTDRLTMTWLGNTALSVITLYATDDMAGVNEPQLATPADEDSRWFNLQGIEVPEPSAPGLYIHGGKKILVK